MPVIASVKRRRQGPRRRYILIAVQIVRDLVRILLMHTRQRQIRKALRGFCVEVGGVKGGGEEEKSGERGADHGGGM